MSLNGPAAIQVQNILQKIDADPAGEFATALDRVAQDRVDQFHKGVEAYQTHPWARTDTPTRLVQDFGTSRLLDYFPKADQQALPALIIPSMINRHYIVDLLPGRSFVSSLASKGVHPYVLDWGTPGPDDQDLSLEDYIQDRARQALAHLTAQHDQPVAVIGYCMGGLMSLGLAHLEPEKISRLVLLATPWDFHAAQASQRNLIDAARPALDAAMDATGQLPVDVIQFLFASLDPFRIHQKFRDFANVRSNTSKARHFVALEDWLNDGVPLVPDVARECLFDWYVDNRPHNGNWQVGGDSVRPESIRIPTLAVIPQTDRIVPPGSALALAKRLADCKIKKVDAGHIGMMVGRNAGRHLYAPVAQWLTRSRT